MEETVFWYIIRHGVFTEYVILVDSKVMKEISGSNFHNLKMHFVKQAFSEKYFQKQCLVTFHVMRPWENR